MQKNLQSAELFVYPEPLIKALNALTEFIEKEILIQEIILLKRLEISEAESLSNAIFGKINQHIIDGLTFNTQRTNIIINESGFRASIPIYLIGEPPPQKTERITPSCTIVYVNEPISNAESFMLELSRFIDNAPFLFLITSNGITVEKKVSLGLKNLGIFVFIKDIGDVTDENRSVFAHFLDNDALQTNLTDLSAICSLNNISSYLGMYIEQDIAEIQTKKMSLQQQIGISQKQNEDRNIQSDIIQNVKNQTQLVFNDFEKGVKRHLDENFRTKTGRLWYATETSLDELAALDSEKKAKRHEFVIPPLFENNFLNNLYQHLNDHCAKDISSMSDMYDSFSLKMEEDLGKSNIAVVPYYFKHLTDDSYRKILDSTVRIDRPYKSELRRMGGYEYFMAIRRYQMIFFMMFSTFGLSFIRGMLEIMIPLTIILLVIGGYFVFKTVKKEKDEMAVKELDKAKESLLNETKRMFSDVQREWPSVITEHQREQMQAYIAHIERHVKGVLSKRLSDQGDKKQLLNKQIQGIDVKEKKLAAAQISNNQLQHHIVQYEKELRQQIKTIADAITPV
ncbi:MAG: hypothetical protein WCM76_06750 [Bacteroidota bacterium]